MALRWILGIVTALVGGGWLALVVLADGFRRSFGASENGPLIAIGPMLVAALLLASLVAPGQRFLLHSTAVVVVAMALGSLWLLTESTGLGVSGLLYCGLWFLFYWRAGWTPAAMPIGNP